MRDFPDSILSRLVNTEIRFIAKIVAISERCVGVVVADIDSGFRQQSFTINNSLNQRPLGDVDTSVRIGF